MQFARSPEWDLGPGEAAARQRALAGLVSLEDSLRGWEVAAGVDLATGGRGSAVGRAAVVAWRRSDGAVIEQVVVEAPLRMPYIPGLLAFREGPLVEEALRLLRTEPDVVLFDGQGIAHPRGLGIAAHLGVLLDRPSVGVAKSRLYGAAADPGPRPGDRAPLLAPDGRLLGCVLRSRPGSRPLYVSPGHRLGVDTACRIALDSLRGHRLPEPLHLADRLSRAPRAA